MVRTEVIAQLKLLPGAIEEAERALAGRVVILNSVKERLQTCEAALLLNGVEGKNEAERKAYVFQMTAAQRADLTEAENTVALARIERDRLDNEFKAMRCVARLIEPREE